MGGKWYKERGTSSEDKEPTQPWHLTDAGAKQCLSGCELLRNVCTGLGGVAEDKRDETWRKMVAHYGARIEKRRKWVNGGISRAGVRFLGLPNALDRERGNYLLDEAYAGLSGLELTPEEQAPKPEVHSVHAVVRKIAREHGMKQLTAFEQAAAQEERRRDG